MQLNKDMFRDRIFKGNFEGNYHQCAHGLNVHVAQLHRIINSEKGVGAMFLGRLKIYCEENGYDFDDFIFLPKI